MKISRLNSIEQYVISKQTVSIDELCEVFGVSKNTIRRDLNELENRGHIAKVYGGVTASTSHGSSLPAPIRSNMHSSDKNLIGELSASMVDDCDTIFIDSGTTAPCILRHLSNKRKITVVTHSLSAITEASKYENISIISTGGMYNSLTNSFVGISTYETISRINIDKAFMSASGVSIDFGMTNSTFLETEIKRSVVQKAKNIYLMADKSKIGKNAVISYCYLNELTAFITDCKPSDEYIEYFRSNKIKLLYP